MSARERPLSARLEELGQAVATANRRARDAELAHRRAEADVARLRDTVVDGYAAGNDAQAAKASQERDKAVSTTLRDAAERHEGAQRAAARTEVEQATFAAAHVDALVAERLPDAVAVALNLEQAVEQLVNVPAHWNAIQADVAALLRLAGRDTATLPQLPASLASLVREARRVAGVSVPPPVPGGQAMTPVPAPPVIPAPLAEA